MSAQQDEKQKKTVLDGSEFVVACVGGGQLGRMMSLEAPRLGISMKFLDPLGSDCPAAQTVPSSQIMQGNLKDAQKIRELSVGAESGSRMFG